MPDFVGLRTGGINELLSQVDESAPFEVSSSWDGQELRDCSVVPGTVVRQAPRPGSELTRRDEIELWLGYLDPERFRGPCDPDGGDLGPLRGADARLAREFYRFAADPALGAPFVEGEVWVGIETGPALAMLSAVERGDLASWDLDTWYAERSEPVSPLDTLVASGGRYELHHGVVAGCTAYNDGPPAELADLRAITLTAATDTVGACMDWWGVTLFLEEERIAGVALRLGAP